MEEYKGQLKHYKFNIARRYKKEKDENGHHVKAHKCMDIFTFDTESSSAWIKDGQVIGYHPGEEEDYWNKLTPLNLTYIWQFSVNGICYYGRELESFLELLNDLPDADLIIWVHNYAYDHVALTDILTWDHIFARSPRHPIYAVPEEYPHITFRCSYFLTNMSLEKWGKELGIPKLVGQLDYNQLYTPLSELPAEAYDYAERDCQVIYKGIEALCKEYKSIFKIPLTATGRTRKVIKKLLMDDIDYRRSIKKLVPANIYEYNRLQHLFAGGLTRTNRLYSNMVIYAKDFPLLGSIIEHYDFASSYPYVMFMKLPMGKWVYLAKRFIPTKEEMQHYAYIMDLKFTGLKAKTPHSYIQSSKCVCKHAIYDNGRIINADELSITVNEYDYQIIEMLYTWDSIEVERIWKTKKDYLPRAFLDYILTLYEQKTGLKHSDPETYMQAKRQINSLFGMTVTSLLQADVELINNDEWIIKPLTKEQVDEKLNKLRDWRDSEQHYFLNYSWGIWITSIARFNLMRCMIRCDIEADRTGLEHMGMDVLYCDTDSIFCIGRHDYSWYNEEVDSLLKEACNARDLDFNRTRPLDEKGKAHPLGYFEKEVDITEFVSCHAKCYCVRNVLDPNDPEADGQLHMTISGINKDAVKCLNDDIENFRDGFVFDKDNPNVKKRLSHYLNSQPEAVWPDGYVSHQQHGVNMRPTGYQISITDEYANVLKLLQEGIELNETGINRLRGAFIC